MPETYRRPVAIEGVLAEHGRLVDTALDRYLPSEDAPPADVHRAMRHSVFAGGKRLRPILVIATRDAARALAPLGSRGAQLEGLAAYLLERDR